MRLPPKLKIAAAILLIGASLAWHFRKEDADPASAPQPWEPLVRRAPVGPIVMEIAPPLARQVPQPLAEATPAPQASAAELLARNPAAPRIADEYPGSAASLSTERLASAAPASPVVAVAQPSEHKIVDGDTLAALALDYLGDARRAEEIFEANRQVLSDPELLPIGAKLRIPPR